MDINERILRLEKDQKLTGARVTDREKAAVGAQNSLQEIIQGLQVLNLTNWNGSNGDVVNYNFYPIGCCPEHFLALIGIADGGDLYANADFGFGRKGTVAYDMDGNVIFWSYPRTSGPETAFSVQIDPPYGYTALSWSSPPEEIADPSYIPCYLLSPDPVLLAHCGPSCPSYPYGMGWTGDSIYLQATFEDISGGTVYQTFHNLKMDWNATISAWTAAVVFYRAADLGGTTYVYFAADYTGIYFSLPSTSAIIGSTTYRYLTADGGTSTAFGSPLTTNVSGFILHGDGIVQWQWVNPSSENYHHFVIDATKTAI